MVKPSSARAGDYVEITGIAESGVDYIKFNVSDDASGKVVHTYLAPVSGTGSFQYGFHVDMNPGQYNIVGTNPSMGNNLAAVLTVIEPQATGNPADSNVTVQPTSLTTLVQTQADETTTVTTNMEGTLSKTGIAPVTIILALCVFGAVMILRSDIRKN
ncbi:MAG: hypothetical protein OS112_05920 [Methanoregula sp.]|nr:MAG: hypothetical protein OS112_05920 [Methanoregula sp.]